MSIYIQEVLSYNRLLIQSAEARTGSSLPEGAGITLAR